ncbi:MAG: sugar ABC transporter substrate-binding protein, partial [Treponema sp.]|nr:sugar ABC transporter substrate-binding protein [Treponema sp.]
MMKKVILTAMAALLATSLFAAKPKTIKVGIINNDPNESGYRTANDRDMKATFTKKNGYQASFAYSLKNDEQIAAAKKFIQDEVDYLLISAAGTSGWNNVLKDAQ